MTREEAIKHLDAMIYNSRIVKGIVPDEYDIAALRMAIEALSAEPPYQYSKAYVEQIRGERDILQDMVDNMAKPKTGWIPVSERLPEKSKQVMCCDKQGRVFTSAMTYINSNGEPSFGKHYSAIAWMPLPEPWKDGEEE